jgi:hypothetical protein
MSGFVRNFLAALALTVCVFAVTATASAAKRGSIGGPPTRSAALAGALRHAKALTKPIVIGRGDGTGGRIELVAFHSARGLCLVISRPRLGRRGSTPGGGCGAAPRPLAGEQLFYLGASSEWMRGRGYLYFDEEWALNPAIARLAVVGRLAGHKGRSRAGIIYANPTPTMLQQLKETSPFALALAVWPDCVLESTVRATAFDAGGTPLQSDTAFPSSCF